MTDCLLGLNDVGERDEPVRVLELRDARGLGPEPRLVLREVELR